MDDPYLSGTFVIERRGENIIVSGRPDVMDYFRILDERAAQRLEAGIARLKQWRGVSRPRLAELKKLAKQSDYLNNHFIALDSEGQEYAGAPIARQANIGKSIPYEDHKIFLWGAAPMDEAIDPDWLIHPETVDADKLPLDPVAVLEWLVSQPEKWSEKLIKVGRKDRHPIFVMFSFGYDVIHILKHLRFEKAWEVFKNEKYDPDKAKRKDIGDAPVLCGDRFDQFAMKYRHRKWLRIWKLRDPLEPYRTVVNDKGEERRALDFVARITIYDAYPFFQESFGKLAGTLVKMAYAKQETVEFLEEMKAKRGRFANEPLSVIQQYTTIELRYLARIMDVLRKTFDDLRLESRPNMRGLRLNAWYGPGAVAGALLKAAGVLEHYGSNISVNPSGPQLAVHHAFFGARIEQTKNGYSASCELSIMDLSSAYPAGLAELPSLKEGAWHNSAGKHFTYGSLAELRLKIEAASAVSMFKIDFQFPEYEVFHADPYQALHVPFFPLPYRTARRAIYFPFYGRGWYMRDHALAAVVWLERFVTASKWKDWRPVTGKWEYRNAKFVIEEAWIFEPQPGAPRPFDFLKELYAQRVQYKLSNSYDVREKFYKLPMNSVYGKTAQAVGGATGKPEYEDVVYEQSNVWSEELQRLVWTDKTRRVRVGEPKVIQPPKTANPYYAAATTAYAQRRLMEAACLDPYSILFFATDGIVSTRLIEGLPRVKVEGEQPELGDWEYRRGHSGVFIQSGVYSYQKYENGEWHALTKTRGLDPKRVTREKRINDVLVDQFLRAARRPYDPALSNPIAIPSKHLVTIGMALAMAERKRELWPLAGRWSPEPGTPEALPRYIDCDEPGKKRRWIEGREADWQSTETSDARRVSDYVPTIPARNPEPPGTMSARYSPEWLDADLRDEIEDGDEQMEIAEAV